VPKPVFSATFRRKEPSRRVGNWADVRDGRVFRVTGPCSAPRLAAGNVTGGTRLVFWLSSGERFDGIPRRLGFFFWRQRWSSPRFRFQPNAHFETETAIRPSPRNKTGPVQVRLVSQLGSRQPSWRGKCFFFVRLWGFTPAFWWGLAWPFAFGALRPVLRCFSPGLGGGFTSSPELGDSRWRSKR